MSLTRLLATLLIAGGWYVGGSQQVGLARTTVAADADTTDAEIAQRDEEAFRMDGRASYYGYELAGRPTANGERFDPEKLTAAHRTLPFGTRLRVTNVRNGRSVVVRINDRGPFVGERILDLSYGAAREIDMIRRGTARVRIDVLD